MKAKYYISLIVALLCVSCQTDPPLQEGGSGEVTLKLTLDRGWDLVTDDAQTKAPVSEDAINDAWVFQFDGTGNGSVLATPPKYTTSLTQQFPFVNKGSRTQTIVVIANTGNEFYPWGLITGVSTLADLLEKSREVRQEADMYPAGPLLLFGMKEERTDGYVSTIPISMKHNAARIWLSLACTKPAIVITSVQLCNVPARQWLVGEGRSAQAPFPADRSVDRVDYEAVTSAALLPSSNGTYKDLKWYMPTNMRGRVGDGDNPKAKNIYAPKDATYIRITALDTSNSDTPVEYVFYPGADMVADFNIEPNHSYYLKVTIRGIDDADIDSRIEYKGGIVSMAGKTANCYILNPPSTFSNKYRIYPTQVDRYWGAYEGMHEYKLEDNVQWKVDVLWMDDASLVTASPTDANITISKDTGRGVNDYFEITVPSTAKKGNFVVYLYRADDPQYTILWSWHMWVTSYDPDITRLAPSDTQFVYPVGSGNVHRYQGEMWTEGTYREKFIMDRDLGYMENLDASPNNAFRGILHYQYGRKDPYPNNATVYNLGGPQPTTLSYEPGGSGSGIKIRDGVKNPRTVYQMMFDWSDPDDNSVNDRVWRDKFTYMPLEQLKTNDQKSIYDPCPYGWRVPNYGVFEDFVLYSTAVNATRGLQWNRDSYDNPGSAYHNALRYWPMVNIDGNYPVWGDIKLTPSGYRNIHETSNGASVSGASSYVRYWYNSYYVNMTSATQVTTDYGGMYFAATATQITQGVSLASNAGYAYSVRCVSQW